MKLMRLSGLPVDEADLEAFDKAFKAEFDRIQAEAGLDMLKMHADLAQVDTKLLAQFPNTIDVDMPKSQKSWLELMSRFDTPIMIARAADGKHGLVLVLVDKPLSV